MHEELVCSRQFGELRDGVMSGFVIERLSMSSLFEANLRRTENSKEGEKKHWWKWGTKQPTTKFACVARSRLSL
jgi:hypothetical protein